MRALLLSLGKTNIVIAKQFALPPISYAIAVALALMIALAFASVIKARLLARLLGAPINNLRWALVWATGGATLLGWGATKLPEWAELILGVPVILGVYCWIIWTRGFGPSDRALFTKNPADGAE